MDKLNKYYLDSSWKKMQDVNEQKKIVSSVAKEHGLDATIKVKFNKSYNMYDIMVKMNRAKF